MSGDAGQMPGGGSGPAALAPRFTLDLVFGLAFQAIGRGLSGFVLLFLWSFVLLAAVGGAVYGGWAALSTPPSTPGGDPSVDPLFAIVAVLAALLYLVGIALIHLTTVGLAYAVLRHRRLPLATLFALSLRRFWPATGGMLLSWLGIMAGTLLFLVPGVILLVRWWVWPAACLIEGHGGAAALGRSAVLTRGLRWPIFWVWLVTFLVSGALNQVATALAEWHFAFGILSLAVYGFASVFWSSLVVAVYVALREREGSPAPDLVAAAS